MSSSLPSSPSPPGSRLDPQPWSGLQPRRLLARFASLLRWIDVPLESLAGPFGAGEALKEAKKALEAAVADEQDRAQGV